MAWLKARLDLDLTRLDQTRFDRPCSNRACQRALCESVCRRQYAAASLKRTPLEAARFDLARAEGKAAAATTAHRMRRDLVAKEGGGGGEAGSASIASGAKQEAAATATAASAALAYARANDAVVASIRGWLEECGSSILEWLRADGELHILRALHAVACEPLMARLNADRYAAYRCMLATSAGLRVAAKAARQVASRFEAAEVFSAELEQQAIHQVIY